MWTKQKQQGIWAREIMPNQDKTGPRGKGPRTGRGLGQCSELDKTLILAELIQKAEPQLGSGERFRNLTSKLSGQKGVTDPKALAASIGRKKYGKEKFQALAAAGKKPKE